MTKFFFYRKSFWIILILYQILLIQSFYFSLYFNFLSIILFFLNVIPIYYYYLNYKKINYIPIFYYSHIYFFCCYTLAVFFPELIVSIFENNTFRTYFTENFRLPNPENTFRYLSDEIIKQKLYIQALEIFIVGMLFFNIGNYFVEFFFKTTQKKNKIFDFSKNTNEILLLGLLSYFLSSIFIFQENFVLLKKLYQIKYPLTYLSILSIQLYIILNTNLKLYYKLGLYFLIFVVLFLELLDGSVSKSFLFAISLYLLNFLVTKKINFRYVCLIIFISFFFHTFKYEYRNIIWSDNNELNTTLKLQNLDKVKEIKSLGKINIIQKSKILVNSYSDSIQNINTENFLYTKSIFLKRNFSRLTHSFQSLVVVTSLSPDRIPYWKGYSYKVLLTKLVPRVFWGDKPSDTLGNAFGIRYNVLSATDNATSWNMPVLNEFYVNFGFYGMIVGMLFLGALFKAASIMLNYNYNNYLFLVSFITLYPLFYLESHLSLTFGAIIQTFIFLLVYIFLYKKILTKKLLFMK